MDLDVKAEPKMQLVQVELPKRTLELQRLLGA
jgi:hypothetical protein